MRRRQQLATYTITVLLIYLLWYGLSRLLGSTLLPDPLVVFAQGFREMATQIFWQHVGASAFRILAGLIIAFVTAVPLGLFLGSNPRLDQYFSPLIYLGYPIPKIVLLPIVFVLFGLGETSKVVLVTMIIFFQLARSLPGTQPAP